MAVLRASLSAQGYEMSRDVMRLNRFLGDLVGGPAVLGEWSYTFCLFGTPSASRAVGLAVLRPSSQPQLLRDRPADGADAGVLGRRAELRRCTGRSSRHALFQDEERAGLTLMRSFSPSSSSARSSRIR